MREKMPNPIDRRAGGRVRMRRVISARAAHAIPQGENLAGEPAVLPAREREPLQWAVERKKVVNRLGPVIN